MNLCMGKNLNIHGGNNDHVLDACGPVFPLIDGDFDRITQKGD